MSAEKPETCQNPGPELGQELLLVLLALNFEMGDQFAGVEPRLRIRATIFIQADGASVRRTVFFCLGRVPLRPL